MNKKFLPAYEPPRLVDGKYRWYIVWYAPDSDGIRRRFRETFNLNRIQDLGLRRRRGEAIVAKLEWWLSKNRKSEKFDEMAVAREWMVASGEQDRDNTLPLTNVIEAMELGVKLKATSDRHSSNRTYRSIGGMFIDFLKKRKWDHLCIGELSRRHANAFLDDCFVEKQLTERTYNNYLRTTRTIFSVLQDREYTSDNPFSGIPLKKENAKLRRNFTDTEARIVIRTIQEENRLLFYALLLQYCCFIRPNEVRQLKFEDVDLATGIVFISSRKGKTRRDRAATIPDEFLQYFDPEFFGRFPKKYFIFGGGFKPGPNKPCGVGTMYNKHRLILRRLHKQGKLEDIDGLQWYSWKDTGITDALEFIPIVSVQDQAGHANPDMTMRYRHKRRVNKQVKEGFKNNLLE